MPSNEKVSRERQALLEQTRKALTGLGISNPTAVHGILEQTLGPAQISTAPVESTAPPLSESPKTTLPATDGVASSTQPRSVPSPSVEQVYELPLDALEPSPDQPRMDLEPDPEFIENIRIKGVRTPIHVRPIGQGRYQIVAGERRWRASQILGKMTIPALIRNDSVDEAAAEALIDNLLRKNLTGYEEAKGYKKLIDQFHYQHEELAQRIGCDRTRITRALQVLQLPEHILEMTLGPGSPLSLTHVQELLPLRSNPVRLARVARQAIEEGWTARRIREEVSKQPRINQGAQSSRFIAKAEKGPFNLFVRFHPNRAGDIPMIRQDIAKALQRLNDFEQQTTRS